ncbi:MAG: DDE-type integrase/transposase/recombinase [Gemmatimonadota bacterium]
MTRSDDERHDGWARLRFAVVGPLLSAPPGKGELRAEIEKLAAKTWLHPMTDQPVRFGVSTIERWYYAARNERQDPVRALRRRVREDAGRARGISARLAQTLRAQYEAHKTWSVQLHVDNLRVLVAQDTTLGPMPSYSTVRRWMKSQGLFRRKRVKRRDTPGAARAEERLESREVRSYENPFVSGLWHTDFHVCSRKVLTPAGRWITPHAFAAVDDHARLACHVQWYATESSETLAHGLSQAFQKRGLPRALMTDRGSAMLAAEIREGLHRLSVAHCPTLEYSPYQNAKQESLWGPTEGRLLAMLEGVRDLTLTVLNEATQAWFELEYNRKPHREIGVAPLARFLADPSQARSCPSSDDLRRAFRLRTTRSQRRSDGTVSVESVRFEVPNRFRHLERVTLRYARWDLTSIDLVDPRTDDVLAALYPLDKAANADGRRRALVPIGDPAPPPASGIAPLLKQLLADYAATGLPPAYIPLAEKKP